MIADIGTVTHNTLTFAAVCTERLIGDAMSQLYKYIMIFRVINKSEILASASLIIL